MVRVKCDYCSQGVTILTPQCGDGIIMVAENNGVNFTEKHFSCGCNLTVFSKVHIVDTERIVFAAFCWGGGFSKSWGSE